MPDGLDKLAQGIGDAIKTVPELYHDGFQPAVQEGGKLLARIPRAINAAFSGLDKWILGKEYNIEETKKLLAEKLATVEPEKIVEPEAYVAIPALQAISYSMNSEELRNLYANLLAKSMNSDTKDSVHPAYVDIIKQMSPNDANIFKIIYETELTPLINLSVALNTGGYNYHTNHISWITSYSYDSTCLVLDNLVRLGLIQIPADLHYSADSAYDLIRHTTFYQASKQRLESLQLGSVNEDKKVIQCTALAKSFYSICILN